MSNIDKIIEEKIASKRLEHLIDEAIKKGYNTKADIKKYVNIELGIPNDQTDRVLKCYQHDKVIMQKAKEGKLPAQYLIPDKNEGGWV